MTETYRDPNQALLDAAHLGGLSLVPADSSKKPKVRWKEYQDRRQTEQEFNDLGAGSVWGVVTGALYGFVVLDFDGPDGMKTMDLLGIVDHVLTPTGAHVYVQHPGHPVKTNARQFPQYPGMDVRGDGGIAWFCGRSTKGVYEPRVWPPAPIALAPELAAELFPRHAESRSTGSERREFRGQGRGEPEAIRFVERAAQEIERSEPGASNAALNKYGYSVGGLVASGQLNGDWAYEVLETAAENRGAQDIPVVLSAAIEAGASKPWSFAPAEDEWVPAIAYKTFHRGLVPEPVPFPVSALPDPLAEFTVQGATTVSAPLDYIGTGALVAMGFAIGGYVTLEVTETWSESANLYAAMVGPPGARKSPSMGLVMAPIWEAEGRLEDVAKAQRAQAEEDGKWNEVEPPALVVDDATIEAFFGVLEKNDRGLLLAPDELQGWVSGMGQYKGGLGRDRQHWLSIWSRRPVKVNRVKGSSRTIRHPFVSVLGGIQPEPLEAMMHGKDDGLLPRLLLAQGDFVTPRLRRGTMSPALQAAYAETWNRLRDEGAVEDKTQFTGPGFERFESWANDHYESLGHMPPELSAAWAKLDGQCARICLILARLDQTSVTPEIVDRAALLIRYYQGQAAQLLQGTASVTPWERQQKGRVMAVARFLQDNPGAGRPDVMAKFEWAMDVRTIERVFESLQEMGLGNVS